MFLNQLALLVNWILLLMELVCFVRFAANKMKADLVTVEVELLELYYCECWQLCWN